MPVFSPTPSFFFTIFAAEDCACSRPLTLIGFRTPPERLVLAPIAHRWPRECGGCRCGSGGTGSPTGPPRVVTAASVARTALARPPTSSPPNIRRSLSLSTYTAASFSFRPRRRSNLDALRLSAAWFATCQEKTELGRELSRASYPRVHPGRATMLHPRWTHVN